MKSTRMLALMLALIMLFTCLTGCGRTNTHGNMAMGRYVEEITDFGEERISGYGSRLHRLSNGRIVISDSYKPFLVSDDNGETWKEDDREWHTRMLSESSYASEIAIGADNTAAVIYNSGAYDEADDGYIYNQRLLVIRPDGTETPIDIPASGDDKYPHIVGISDNGRIFVSISGSSDIYEINEDGSCIYFMTVQGESPELMQFKGNLMFLGVPGYESLLIYDMEKKEYVEDDVLNDFIKENYPDGNSYNGKGIYQMYFFTGEEGVIYIAGKKGLHRHVIGGSAMEQIIDGSHCTFNNPSYEIGMEEGSSVTREDALKKLNTKIMAGEGPDVLVLDDMPLDSYVGKSMLLNLSTILGSLSGEEEVFDNIVQAMKMDDKVYAMPCEIQIPVMMGAEKYISQVKDIESIADMMEELRKDNPEKDLLGICTEKGIMRYFAMSCVPAWTTENGELDREAIAKFLEQTKRIYDAQTDGLPKETIIQLCQKFSYMMGWFP